MVWTSNFMLHAIIRTTNKKTSQNKVTGAGTKGARNEEARSYSKEHTKKKRKEEKSCHLIHLYFKNTKNISINSVRSKHV